LSSDYRFYISDFSEDILLVELDQAPEHLNFSSFFLSLSTYLRKNLDWVEVVVAEKSISVKYDYLKTTDSQAKELILSLVKEFDFKAESKTKTLLRIPVYYSDEFGLDIEQITKTKSITIEELINLHSNIEYEVKMIGFNPGFAYLGDLDEELRIPRLSKPRINLLPGSVGIAENRTGIYPFGGPGGWNIVGRTPIKLFDENKENPFLIKQDMRVKFEPITKKEFESFNK
jgi:KipI family sensor histidine kinase inhibitor|tara:strand:+ start:86 stop:775 length:690 start_codon:yes stop_codon:yes gene_type:complete